MAILFNSYSKTYAWLSNFSSHSVYGYPTAEHAYQASKTTDPIIRTAIRNCGSPVTAKATSKTFPLREDWGFSFSLRVMWKICKKKIDTHPQLAESLAKSHPLQICHLSPWDEFWGTGKGGDGEDWLGRIWESIRAGETYESFNKRITDLEEKRSNRSSTSGTESIIP